MKKMILLLLVSLHVFCFQSFGYNQVDEISDNNTFYNTEGSISISIIDSFDSILFTQKKISYDDYVLLNIGIN